MILCPWKDLTRYIPAIPGLEEAMEKVNFLTSFAPAVYPLSGGNRVVVMSGTTVPFDEEKDVGFYTGEYEYIRIGPGRCYVAFPEDAHLPSRHLDQPNQYTKIVVKLKV